MSSYLFVLLVGLIAGAVSGIVGTGSSAMLLPVLVVTFGPKQAVPIMAVASVLSNISRVVAWWRETDWKAVAAYGLPGVPAAALGAHTLLILPAHLIEALLGVFFIVMIPMRRWLKRVDYKIGLGTLAVCGALIGFLTGLVLSTGPLSVPAFTAYGLVKGSFLASEAASSLLLYISKVSTFWELGALPPPTLLKGVIVGFSLMTGTFVGKAVVLRMSTELFHHLLDVIMLAAGISMLWTAAH